MKRITLYIAAIPALWLLGVTCLFIGQSFTRVDGEVSLSDSVSAENFVSFSCDAPSGPVTIQACAEARAKIATYKQMDFAKTSFDMARQGAVRAGYPANWPAAIAEGYRRCAAHGASRTLCADAERVTSFKNETLYGIFIAIGGVAIAIPTLAGFVLFFLWLAATQRTRPR